MPNTTVFRAMPHLRSGLVLTTVAVAWTFTPWQIVAKKIKNDIYITGITFETAFVFSAADNTQEQLFEIGIGRPDNAVTKLQFPHSCRSDSAVGFYRTQAYNLFLPEPYLVPELSTICIRVARDKATAVSYNGVKVLYQSDQPLEERDELVMNNYLFSHGASDGGEVIY